LIYATHQQVAFQFNPSFKQSSGDAEPFGIERFPANGFSGAAVPVGGIALVAFLAMQVGVYPGTLRAFVLLSGFVGLLPIAFGIPP